jgi:oligoribonuclease NrnB/cAMP/cGMP phosphodiesterase (DHH superfamily)
LEKNPNIYEQLEKLSAEELIEEGKREIQQVQEKINKDLVKSFPILLGGKDHMDKFGKCLAVITENSDLRSELGNQLALKSKSLGFRGIGAVVYVEEGMQDHGNKLIKINAKKQNQKKKKMKSLKYPCDQSLKKVKLEFIFLFSFANIFYCFQTNDIDTTVISQLFGGGGHKNASSFSLSKQIFNDFWKTN